MTNMSATDRNPCTDKCIGECPQCQSSAPCIAGFIDDGECLWAVCHPCEIRWVVAAHARSASEWRYSEVDVPYVVQCISNRNRLEQYPVLAPTEAR